MTQRIFDTDNEEDMKLLWSILPDWVTTIKKSEKDCAFLISENGIKYGPQYIKINWHDATEITCPVNYEDMIGCVGYFWDNEDDPKRLGVFKYKDKEYFCDENESRWVHFIPVKESELKFWEDVE